ncbi:MAG: hypothetical protein AVDCRST_MAG26-2657 [uncultured Chloroflexia bacterium]|uniref:Uncharacterized protein n=1 Tax=uncultured Chloroflexia bacterium TaxID=1672391 RepID=A0A6J4J4P6_9CHLR|nr:MAG: hypothetical protein AVDCRST_MAG26-2657 [uncultured Chloroflexia bacterium]
MLEERGDQEARRAHSSLARPSRSASGTTVKTCLKDGASGVYRAEQLTMDARAEQAFATEYVAGQTAEREGCVDEMSIGVCYDEDISILRTVRKYSHRRVHK